MSEIDRFRDWLSQAPHVTYSTTSETFSPLALFLRTTPQLIQGTPPVWHKRFLDLAGEQRRISGSQAIQILKTAAKRPKRAA
jgi:hypothetical protein